MAKGKNAAALFEVINKSKGLAGSDHRGRGLATPRWWFNGNKKAPATPPPAATVAPAAAASVAPEAPPVVPAPVAERKVYPPAAVAAAVPVAAQPAPKAPAAGAADDTKPVHLDSDRGEIKVRVSYVGAVVSAVAVVAIVITAVLVGKHFGSSSATPGNESTEQLQAGPANPGVLQPTPGHTGSNGLLLENESPTPVPTPSTPTGTNTPPTAPPANRPTATPQTGGSTSPVTPPARVSRVIGHNYVIVQSWDPSEEADARAVIALLAQRGIATTIERNVQGFGRRLVVISAEGWPPRSRELTDLSRRVDQISADAARADRKWRALTPMQYRWK